MPPRKRTARTKPRGVKKKTIKAAANWKKPTPSRHHIFLFDGTCNDETGANPEEFDWDQVRQVWVSKHDVSVFFPPIITNVAKTMHALGRDSAKQLTHYFRGIGNDDENDAINSAIEGAFAHEDEAIRYRAYVEFLRNYRLGDQISILGFSRGAAAARLFANDLRKRGLLDKVIVDRRLRHSNSSGESWEEISTLFTHQSKTLAKGAKINISFVGIWDTVATSMGVSPDELEPTKVGHMVHCLALDEERDLFSPTLLKTPRAPNVKEVWFPGCHSDIGGGYFNDALGRVTLKFMWDNWNTAMAKQGLPELSWNEEAVSQYTDTTGLPWLRHNEDNSLTAKGGLSPRICRAADRRKPRLHTSVEEFVQMGGLRFCHPEEGFPPKFKISGSVYDPPAYPGVNKVELFDSVEWI